MACNTPLNYMPQEVVDKAVALYDPSVIRRYGVMEWAALLRKLDRRDPSYREPMRRRRFLATAASRERSARDARDRAGGESRVLKFIPQADLTALDPVWTSAYVTRNHGYLVFDTLYGQDSAVPRPSRRWWRAPSPNSDGSCGGCACATGCCSTTARRCWRATAWPASGAGAQRDAFGQTLMADDRRTRRPPTTGRSCSG